MGTFDTNLTAPTPRNLVVLGTSAAQARPTYESLPPSAFAGPPVDALYVHVPFCTTKCHYCDFYSLAGHLGEADHFLNALAEEISQWRARQADRIRPETIFIGGGTPTLLDAPRLGRLLALITEAIDPSRLREFTIEANPNTFDPDRA